MEVVYQMKPSITATKLQKGLVILGWLGLWQIGCQLVGKEVLVPSPFHTFETLCQMMQTKVFYLQILWTLQRVALGVGLSTLLGFITALTSYKIKGIKWVLAPMISLMKSTPIMAIIILALLWFKSNEVPIFVCILMCYPIVYTNLYEGLSALDRQLIEMSKIYKVKKKLIFRKCYWPQLIGYLSASLELGIGMAWKVVIAAEVLALPQYAIGDSLLEAKLYIETAQVFAWIIVIVVLSQGCERGVRWILKRGRWHD